jgi:hypothetical protein
MWERGRFTGKGLAEILQQSRSGKPLTSDQFIITNFGLLPAERQTLERRKSGERD